MGRAGAWSRRGLSRAGFVDAGVLGLGGGGRIKIRLELGDGVVLHLTRR